jgi:plasmid replication initiation protein
MKFDPKDLDYTAPARYNTVVKANTLIQNSRFSLTAQQQKIVLYLISKIKPEDDEFTTYKFHLKDFCAVCGINLTNCGGFYYEDLKEQIKKIADKSLWVNLDEQSETLIRWIEKPTIRKDCGIIELKLDNDLKPYLLQLKRNYTEYELIYTLNFKSKYSIRFYELIKSVHYNESAPYTRIYSIEDLKKIFCIEKDKYKQFQHFKDKVLQVAVKEINEHTDKHIEIEYIKTGKKYTDVKVVITTKPIIERINTTLKNNEFLESRIKENE